MPQGKGTYGKKVGRPPLKQKTKMQTAKQVSKDFNKSMDNIYQKGGHRDKGDMLTANIVNTSAHKKSDDWNKTIKKHNEKQTAAPKMASPLEYAPFKMKAASHGNSPMRKNFGIGDSEMPIKTAPVKFGFRGLASKLFGRNKEEQQPEQPQDPVAQATQAAQAQAQPQAQGTMMQQEMAAYGKKAAAGEAEQAGGAEGGEVQPHGPEAHTGGAGPIGGAQNKKPQGFMGGVSRFF